jgi:hypothetical protein
MSPYLFWICGEGLTALLNNHGSYIDRGIQVSFKEPWVNHLLFADDRLIFMSVCAVSAERLTKILNIYAECSGQKVNKEKSSIYFSPNALQPLRDSVKSILGITVESLSERYLGLPTAVGRITSGMFDHIVERSSGCMQGWSEGLLSSVARETLLKAVIQAIPTFGMSYFKLTKKVLRSLVAVMARIRWSSSV